MRIAVVGMGNVGREVVKCARNAGMEVTAVFSRRAVEVDGLGKALPFERIEQRADSFDLAVMCVGSANDSQSILAAAKYTDTVDCYDNHAQMRSFVSQMRSTVNDIPDRLCLTACGWDPGVLSVIRGVCGIFPNSTVGTMWGRGVSQGHSNALRLVPGVRDAVQFTEPLPLAQSQANNGTLADFSAVSTHKRVCYVCADSVADKPEIALKILSMPDYFEGYRTEINFTTLEEVARLKEQKGHCGQVFCLFQGGNFQSKLSTDNNAELTARLLIGYCRVLEAMKRDGCRGVVTPLDIAPKYYCLKDYFTLL